MDPVVFSHSRPCGHFTGCTAFPAKKQRVGGRKRQTRIKNCKMQEGEVGIFKHFSVCYLWLSRELSENSTQQSKMLTHLIIVFTAHYLATFLPSLPLSFFPINYITKKIYNTDITVNMQCVTLSKRSPHLSFNKSNTVPIKQIAMCLDGVLLKINYWEGF